MLAILSLGFLLGLQHALEADHVAAVASIVSGGRGASRIIRHGALWGLGHALSLTAFGGLVVLLSGQVPADLAGGLEFLVGAMLVALGAMALYRVWRERIHFHFHRHHGGVRHFHAHSHRAASLPHERDSHDHEHEKSLSRRSLMVGVMHGLAGSAALIAFTMADQAWQGFSVVILFALGSLLGMTLLSAVIAMPLVFTSRAMTGVNRWMQVVIGVGSIAIGAFYMSQQFAAALALTSRLVS